MEASEPCWTPVSDPVLTVLLYATLAAGMGAMGVVPMLGRRQISLFALGVANALAAGLMLGAAYALMLEGLDRVPLGGAIGALLGALYVNLTHRALGTSDLDLNRLDGVDPTYGYKVLLVDTLHGAAEGLAIGVAMVVNLTFGAFVALAIALHNIPEGIVLSAILRSRGARVHEAAGLAVAANIGQVLLAVATFAILAAAPGALPWVLGFAVGTLVYLVMAELLPECYRQAGATSVALVTITALGMIVVLSGLGIR